VQYLPKFLAYRSTPAPASRWRCALFFGVLVFPTLLVAQIYSADNPVPILTGNAGFFTNVQAGKTEIVSEINPVILVPLGEHWLIEARGEFEGDFQRKDWGDGPYGGQVGKELNYLEADYIVSPYVTVTVGRFLTPFGIYNERLYPIWIRDLQSTPLIFPIGTGSSNGVMFRGGFPLNAKVNLNYATYFSVSSTNSTLDSDRTAGGRAGLFFPGPRIEVGASWQKLLQEGRNNAFGFHFAWQPTPLPLNLRSEYARSSLGSGYWIEAAYRLSQVRTWNKFMRRAEAVGRAQQLFVGQITGGDATEYGLPDINTREADFGLNYYLQDGLKATASYGRQFSSDGNSNLWNVGVAYRFALPLGRTELP
jgi:hypothetical protein